MAEGGGTENQIDSELQATAFYQWREEGRSKVTPEEDFELLTSQTLVVKFIPLKNQEGPLSSINGGKKEEVKTAEIEFDHKEGGQQDSEAPEMAEGWGTENQTDSELQATVFYQRREKGRSKVTPVLEEEDLANQPLPVKHREKQIIPGPLSSINGGKKEKVKEQRNKCHSLDEGLEESLKMGDDWKKTIPLLIQRVQEVWQEKQESVAINEKLQHENSAVKDKVQGLEIDNEMLRNKCHSLDERHTESLKESHNWEKKTSHLHQLMKKALHELQEEKEMNKGMRKNQSVWQESVACSEKQLHELSTLKDKEIQDLKDQVSDVMIHMEAQQKLSTTTGVTQEEIQEGQVVVGAASTATSLNRKPRKKKR